MKKLAFLFTAVAALSFASCGNKAAQAEQAEEVVNEACTCAPCEGDSCECTACKCDSCKCETPCGEGECAGCCEKACDKACEKEACEGECQEAPKAE